MVIVLGGASVGSVGRGGDHMLSHGLAILVVAGVGGVGGDANRLLLDRSLGNAISVALSAGLLR